MDHSVSQEFSAIAIIPFQQLNIHQSYIPIQQSGLYSLTNPPSQEHVPPGCERVWSAETAKPIMNLALQVSYYIFIYNILKNDELTWTYFQQYLSQQLVLKTGNLIYQQSVGTPSFLCQWLQRRALQGAPAVSPPCPVWNNQVPGASVSPAQE